MIGAFLQMNSIEAQKKMEKLCFNVYSLQNISLSRKKGKVQKDIYLSYYHFYIYKIYIILPFM